MDRLEAMSILLEAVESGSLSAAGRKLGMPLANISRKISTLETHLKTRLLNRSTQRLTLTDAGRSYVAACRHILEQVSEAERAAAGEYSSPRGDLVVTAPMVFGRLHVLPVILEFLNRYPEINLKLVLSDQIVHLLDDHIDVAIRIGQLVDSSLIAQRLGSVRPIVCASPAYLNKRGTPDHPQELSNHDCVNFIGAAGYSGSSIWAFQDGNSELIVPIYSRLIVNTAESAIDAAIAGIGITRVFSYQIAQAVRDGRLKPILQRFETGLQPISFLHSGQGLLPLKVRAFLDFSGPLIKERVTQNSL